MYCYRNIQFKTRLEAKWSSFFDLAGWRWWVNPKEVGEWAPDFKVKFDCSHSECRGYHSLLVAVLPLNSIQEFGSHPCLHHSYGHDIAEDGGAAFGALPKATHWEIVHGAGGGIEDIYSRVRDVDILWQQAEESLRRDNS